MENRVIDAEITKRGKEIGLISMLFLRKTIQRQLW